MQGSRDSSAASLTEYRIDRGSLSSGTWNKYQLPYFVRPILQKSQNINGNADIIVGDFNAGDYPQYTYWRNFREILPTHVCICNLPTKRVENSNGELIRETCIDHIFVRRELVTKCENLKVHENIKLSDHYPITFNIKL